jgi:hypothetical protein
VTNDFAIKLIYIYDTMASANTVAKGAGHTDLHLVEATSEPSAQKSITTTTTTTTNIIIPEDMQTQKVKSSSEIVTHSEGDVGIAGGFELHEPAVSRKHKTTESDIQETARLHVPEEVDSYADELAESDGYHSIILDVSWRNF